LFRENGNPYWKPLLWVEERTPETDLKVAEEVEFLLAGERR